MHKPLTILLAILLIALSLVAVAFGMADVYQRETEALIEGRNWSKPEEGLPASVWEQAQRYLWLASRLAPFDAQIQNDLGQLYELRVGESPSPEASANLDQALTHYRHALALRPAWPYAWVDVALLKVTGKQIDAEFALAMEQALILGPWQTSVQASIAGGGLAVWDKLPAKLQAQIEDTIARGLSNGSRLMPLIARRFGLLAAN